MLTASAAGCECDNLHKVNGNVEVRRIGFRVVAMFFPFLDTHGIIVEKTSKLCFTQTHNS